MTAEVARFLNVDETDVEQLVKDGRLTGYKLGGQFLRFRPDQVKTIQASVTPRPKDAAVDVAGVIPAQERVADFLYFNDFYLLSGLLLIGLAVYLITAR